MESQSSLFLAGEGDEWFKRNNKSRDRDLEQVDPIARATKALIPEGSTIGEVGCAFPLRLAHLVKRHGGQGWGIDPASAAIEEGRETYPNLKLDVGTAEALPWDSASMDVLVYGFCLYLVDRSQLFAVAQEGDRVLKDGGLLVVLDFVPPFPYRNPYKHKEGIWSYKMDHASLWDWNPAYQRIHCQVFPHGEAEAGTEAGIPDDRIGVTVLCKSTEFAYPVHPEYA